MLIPKYWAQYKQLFEWRETPNKPSKQATIKRYGWSDISKSEAFFYFCIMQHMLKVICPRSSWNQRFKSLLNEFPAVPDYMVKLKDFGLTTSLEDWRLWQ